MSDPPRCSRMAELQSPSRRSLLAFLLSADSHGGGSSKGRYCGFNSLVWGIGMLLLGSEFSFLSLPPVLALAANLAFIRQVRIS